MSQGILDETAQLLPGTCEDSASQGLRLRRDAALGWSSLQKFARRRSMPRRASISQNFGFCAYLLAKRVVESSDQLTISAHFPYTRPHLTYAKTALNLTPRALLAVHEH
jgi:hypothetical protein